mmetsp:Transcript_5262/g.12600  ORF Transcript_5262/g.12600 Transcript_5262/m.12600 type:complete len:248 (-) Transcript_5262:1223-1966(-)
MGGVVAPVLGKDAVVDPRLPQLEDDGNPGFDVLDVGDLLVFDLGFGDKAPKFGFGELLSLNGLVAHGLQEAPNFEAGLCSVLLVELMPETDEGLLHGIAVRGIGLCILLVLFVGMSLRGCQAVREALKLFKLLLREEVCLFFGDRLCLLFKRSFVEHLRDDSAANPQEVFEVHISILVGVHDHQDDVDLHSREADLVGTQEQVAEVPDGHDAVQEPFPPCQQNDVNPQIRNLCFDQSIVQRVYPQLL